MKFWLLTHSEEIKKHTGTGRLVKEALIEDCEVLIWSRIEPDNSISKLSTSNTILIYPQDGLRHETTPVSDINAIENIIIIDGTWQQAKKMYNQSPYLKAFQHREITGVTSIYNKRRNQKSTGLCTAEVVIHLLKEQGHPMAKPLLESFLAFNQ